MEDITAQFCLSDDQIMLVADWQTRHLTRCPVKEDSDKRYVICFAMDEASRVYILCRLCGSKKDLN